MLNMSDSKYYGQFLLKAIFWERKIVVRAKFYKLSHIRLELTNTVRNDPTKIYFDPKQINLK